VPSGQFPINPCQHDGDTTQLCKRVTVLHGLAETLDVLSQDQKIERHALAFAANAMRNAAMKIGGIAAAGMDPGANCRGGPPSGG